MTIATGCKLAGAIGIICIIILAACVIRLYLSTQYLQRAADERYESTLLAKEVRALKAKESRKANHSGAPIILGSATGQAVSTQPRFNDVELSALKAAIDPTTLSLVGLSIGSRGEVEDAKGRKIHKPGFRDAIEKVLSVQVK